MRIYGWGITATKTNGLKLPVRLGQRGRLVFENRTTMWHPLNLHGMTFQTLGAGLAPTDPLLIGARVLQGGAALMMPASLAITEAAAPAS